MEKQISIGKFCAVKRDFFKKGDLVSPVRNTKDVYEFIEETGFSTVKLRNSDAKEFEYDTLANAPLTFAEGFDPGMISANFQ